MEHFDLDPAPAIQTQPQALQGAVFVPFADREGVEIGVKESGVTGFNGDGGGKLVKHHSALAVKEHIRLGADAVFGEDQVLQGQKAGHFAAKGVAADQQAGDLVDLKQGGGQAGDLIDAKPVGGEGGLVGQSLEREGQKARGRHDQAGGGVGRSLGADIQQVGDFAQVEQWG